VIVCVCKAVSDRHIQKEIDHGARTMTDIAKRCSAGTDCGSCCAQIRAMLQERCKPHLRLVGDDAA
jgi:bacterioferritin-associated ferredoxin